MAGLDLQGVSTTFHVVKLCELANSSLRWVLGGRRIALEKETLYNTSSYCIMHWIVGVRRLKRGCDDV